MDKLTHPDLLVPDPDRSILGGCFVREAFKYNPDTWDGRLMFSLSQLLNFPLDSPWKLLPESVRDAILYGIGTTKIKMMSPPDAKMLRSGPDGREVGFHGIARRIERYYRRYRQRGEANSRMEEWLDKVMVERACPECQGARVRATRLLFTINGRNIHELGQLHFDELQRFLVDGEDDGPRRRRGSSGAEGHSQPAGSAARHRSRLPQLQPAIEHALGRRIAAHPSVVADRIGPDGHALRARRTEHRAASRKTTSR